MTKHESKVAGPANTTKMVLPQELAVPIQESHT